MSWELQYILGAFLLGAGLGYRFGYAGVPISFGFILIVGGLSGYIIENCGKRP